MKKVLQFAGVISLALAAVAFVLMMATPAVSYTVSSSSTVNFAGTLAIFGGELDTAQKLLLIANEAKPATLALLAWIFVLVGMIIVLLGVLLPLFKVKAIERFAGLLNLCALILFVVAGIFMFTVRAGFYSAQGFNEVPEKAAIGFGWVFGGILSIIAGAFAIFPAAADFFGKGKKGKGRKK